MPLSELAELVARIDGNDLQSPDARSAIAKSIDQLQAMLDRIGASESAARLNVAAGLLQRTGNGASPTDEEAKRLVRTLLVAVEHAFHLRPDTSAAGTPAEGSPGRDAPKRESKEAQHKLQSRAAELAVVKDMLLGEVLIHFGVLTPEEISAGLELQGDTDQGLGDILVEHKFTTRDEIERALEYQSMIRKLIADKPRARAASEPAASQPDPILPASNGSLGRLRLATELLLGEMLVLQGTVTREELERGLELQRSSGMLIGEALIQTGAATRKAIERALVSQGKGSRISRRSRRDRRD